MNLKSYDNYKDSGIKWIEDVPEHWSVQQLKHVSNIIMGQSPDSSDITEEQNGLLFMQGNADFTNLYPKPSEYCIAPKKISRVGDILMSVRAPVGELNLSDKRYAIGRGLCSIKPIKVNLSYLWFYLTKSKIDFEYYSNGSTFDAITISNLSSFPIVVPKLNEQQEIANYLDKETAKIDETIAKNEELIQLLEEKRIALINQAVTKGLNPDVPMKDSGIKWIGEIPEHWEFSKVKYELNFLDHKRIPLSAEVRSDMDRIYDYYGASGVIDKVDSYLFDGKYILVGEDGANLLSRSTPLAFIAEGKFWVNNHAHILVPKDGNNIDYFVSLLEAVDYTPFIEGSAQPKLTANNLKNVILIKPPLVEQNEIATFLNLELNHINNILSKIQENINLLEEYKTSLIHHVVTGKVDVRGEEI